MPQDAGVVSQAAEAPARESYLRRAAPVPVFGAFFALTVPLVALELSPVSPWTKQVALLAYSAVLGMSHFLMTFFPFLQRSNLKYFAATAVNRVKFLLLPAAAIFWMVSVGFSRQGLIKTALFYSPSYRYWLWLGLYALNAQHFTRQSYGVLQLFKRDSGSRFPQWSSAVENCFFLVLMLLQVKTFAQGADFNASGFIFRPGSFRIDALSLLLGAAGVGLLLAIATAFAMASRTSRRALALPVAYLVLQGASAALVIWSDSWMPPASAMHYVEYHILMWPRCFRSELDLSSWTDRVLGRLRRLPGWVFYAGLVVAGAPFAFGDALAGRADPRYAAALLIVINLHAGITAAHFIVESFIWRFRDPHFGRSLESLYLSSEPAAG